jgi:hypothetical protein
MRHISETRPHCGGAYYKPPREAGPVAKPDREFCKQQISRLGGKQGAPWAAEDAYRLKLVIDALARAAESKEHATKIVDRLETHERFPDGYTVAQVGYELRTREKKANPQCPDCHGIGFTIIPEENGQGKGAKCHCWRDVVVTA